MLTVRKRKRMAKVAVYIFFALKTELNIFNKNPVNFYINWTYLYWEK